MSSPYRYSACIQDWLVQKFLSVKKEKTSVNTASHYANHAVVRPRHRRVQGTLSVAYLNALCLFLDIRRRRALES